MLNGSATRPALAAEIACNFSDGRRPRRGNAATEEPLTPEARADMIDQAARSIGELFDVLLIDHRADPNTRDTPRRVATALVEELLSGRYTPPPRVTQFDDVRPSDGLIVTGPIEVRSMCAHHLMPIYGHAVIGILPDAEGRLVGLSKYDRIVDHFARRLQSQEELVRQIGDFIVAETRPRGLIIRMSAVHMCKTHRGVQASHSGRMGELLLLRRAGGRLPGAALVPRRVHRPGGRRGRRRPAVALTAGGRRTWQCAAAWSIMPPQP